MLPQNIHSSNVKGDKKNLGCTHTPIAIIIYYLTIMPSGAGS
jgi:hypothetical protein